MHPKKNITWNKSKVRVCSKCARPVEKSKSRRYPYFCSECDKYLFSLETELSNSYIPLAEGEKKDSGFKGEDYCDEWCSNCERDNYNIPSNRVSLCVHCGTELFPCSACPDEDDCDWTSDENGCHRFKHSQNHSKKAEKLLKKGQ